MWRNYWATGRWGSRLGTTGLLLVMSIVAFGCEKEGHEKGGKAEAAQKLEAERVGSQSSSGAAEAPQKITPVETGPVTVEAATQLVDEWVRAQNSGAFDKYATLYAPRMSGLKRVGKRETSFDRAGWLADRKSMFARPFTVEVKELKVSLAGGVAVARFEQTWSNPRFRDVGPKQLVIVADGKELRISREEMLESTQGGEKVGGILEPGAVGLVRSAKDELRYLLARKPHLNWMSSSPEMTAGGAVVRELAMQLVPEEERALVGKEFELFDAAGAKCYVVAEKLEVLVDVEPHFGVVNHWKGGEGRAPVPPTQRALELWDMSSSRGQFLSLRLKPKTKQASAHACANPVWGRVVREKANEWLIRDASGGEKQRLGEAALRESDFRAQFEGSGESPSSQNVHIVRIFEHPDGRKYAVANLWAPGSLCGQPMPVPYWVVLRVRGEKASIVSDGEVGSRNGPPLGAVSVPGLSEPVFVSESFVYRFANTGEILLTFLNQETESLDCGC